MLLAVDVGNTQTVLGVFKGSELTWHWRIATRVERTADELALLGRARQDSGQTDLASVVRTTWGWLVAAPHRPLLTLWLEAYARSLMEPEGSWSDFARQTVADWLDVLGAARDPVGGGGGAEAAERTLALAVLRGALLDLLATGDVERVTAAVHRHVDHLAQRSGER